MVEYLSAAWRRRALAPVASPTLAPLAPPWPRATTLRLAAVLTVALATANCASPQKFSSAGGRQVDPKYGVVPSRRLYGENDAIPKGGGRNFTGRPYVVAGRTYTPRQDPRGYVREGLASWYGTAFHGRETANGEVFDRFSVAAAHPTLPLPSYARVTNLANGHSMIVRVNDRGPYHENRVMDVSQRVAEALDFRRAGTTRVRVEYVGKASLRGSDDTKLMATLRTDGRSAPLPGQGSVLFAEAGDDASVRKPTLLAMAASRDGEEQAEPFRPAAAPRPAETRPAPPVRQALAFRPAEDAVEPAPQRKVAAAPIVAARTSHASVASLRPAPLPVAKLPPPTRVAQAAPLRAAPIAEPRPPLRLTPPPLHLASPPLQIARAMPAPPVRPTGIAPQPAKTASSRAAASKATLPTVASAKPAAAKTPATTVALKAPASAKRAKVAEAR